MHTGRILYLNHDNPQPSGGVQVIYDHVGHLVRSGYHAYVVHHRTGFRPSWFDTQVPTLYFDQQFHLTPSDLVIIPEDHAAYLELFSTLAVQKLVFCQSYLFVFDGMRAHQSWETMGISGVITPSSYITDFLHSNLGIRNIQTVHNAVSPVFSPTTTHKKIQISYMPRKRPQEAQFIKDLCMRLLESEYKVEWVAVDGMSQDEAAKIFADSAIFLSLSRLEGFGLPPLEAMASGCLVVGFTGFGGKEYARPDNGLWVEEDDLISCAQTLAAAVRMFQRAPQETLQLTSNACQTASEYSHKRQEQDLLQAIHHFTQMTQGAS